MSDIASGKIYLYMKWRVWKDRMHKRQTKYAQNSIDGRHYEKIPVVGTALHQFIVRGINHCSTK